MKISTIRARQILDSRGNPTVEADVILDSGIMSRAAVPSGASTGDHEAVELRDNDKEKYQGKSVYQAVENIHSHILPAIKGYDVTSQEEIDNKMLELDGTPNKSQLGANAILAVSLACARAGAMVKQQPLFSYLASFNQSNRPIMLPIPFMNVINGGKHAPEGVDFQEFMIVPHGFETFSEALHAAAKTFHTLKGQLHEQKFSTLVGDEGGFAPSFKSNQQALEQLIQAIEAAGYKPGEQISLAMDPAVSEIYDADKKSYVLKTENRLLSSEEMIKYWVDIINRYPVMSLEDGLDQNAWQEWRQLTEQVKERAQTVGDDFLVTNPERLQRAIEENSCTAILIKVNQIGTLTEAIQAINMAHGANMHTMVSHRSGETSDTFIADLVVGMGSGQIKTGSLSRTDRVAKYNQLLRIEETLGDQAVYAGTRSQLG